MSDWAEAYFRAEALVAEHGAEHLLGAIADDPQDIVFKWMCHVVAPSLSILDASFVADLFLGTHAEGFGLFDAFPEWFHRASARAVFKMIAQTMKFDTRWVLDLGRRMQSGPRRIQLEDLWVAAFTEHFADEANKGDDVAEALRPLLESELDFKSFVLFDCIAQRSREGPACVELGLLARVIEEMYDKAKRTPSESRYRRVAIGDEADMRAIADVLDLELPLDARRAFLNMRMLWYWSESPAREREIHEVGKMCRLRNALRPYVWTIKRIASVGLDAPGCGARFKREHGRFTRALQTRM